MLTELKLLLGISDTSKDDLITLLLYQCTADFEAATHTPFVCDNMVHKSVMHQMAVYRYNQIGTEGSSKENYSGVSFEYLSDYPENIKRTLRSLRKVRTIG